MGEWPVIYTPHIWEPPAQIGRPLRSGASANHESAQISLPLRDGRPNQRGGIGPPPVTPTPDEVLKGCHFRFCSSFRILLHTRRAAFTEIPIFCHQRYSVAVRPRQNEEVRGRPLYSFFSSPMQKGNSGELPGLINRTGRDSLRSPV